MVLGIDKIKKLVRDIRLVEGLGKRDLVNPEGAGLDLRVGEIFRIEGETFLGIEKRKTVDSISLAKYDPKKRATFTIKPGEFYLIQTVETINTPDFLLPMVFPRTTLFRSGINLLNSVTSPGYRGKLTFGLKNVGGSSFKLELGARVAHIIFLEVKGKSASYRGQWQGGRVTTKKEETQV